MGIDDNQFQLEKSKGLGRNFSRYNKMARKYPNSWQRFCVESGVSELGHDHYLRPGDTNR